MDKVTFWVKQMFPLDYYTKYRSDGKVFVVTWKQHFGKPYDAHYYEVCA